MKRLLTGVLILTLALGLLAARGTATAAGVPSVAQSTVTVNTTTATAGQPVLVTVTLRDSAGQPLSGIQVLWATNGTSPHWQQFIDPTIGGGIAVATLTEQTPQTAIVGVLANGVFILGPAVTWTP